MTRLWKCGVSSLYIRSGNEVDLSTSSLFPSNQSSNQWIVLNVRLTTLCPMLIPLLPQCFWVETLALSWRVNISQVGKTLLKQRIGPFSELSSLELLAQFHDRLWASPKVFTTFVDLSASGICDLTYSSLVNHFVKLNPPLLRSFRTFW